MNDTESYNSFYHEKAAEAKDEVEEKLGFKPQKIVVYNRLLPYAEDLILEAGHNLAEIKANLGCALLKREIRPGVSHWMGRLDKFIRLHGHMFSKEDHVLFIKALFDLMVTPHLEFTLLAKTANLLVLLMKKRHLLSPKDLELSWKPLHNLLEFCLYNKYESHGLILIPKNLENILKNVVRTCRPYFATSCTREMLEEWRPLLCPFDVSITKGLFYLELFLPTLLAPEDSDQGFRLWFDELILLWDSVTNSPSFENPLVWLFARLAFDNVGRVDWVPWIPKIFSRIMRSFNLPTAGHLNLTGQKSHENYEMTPVVAWIVALLGGGSEAQTHLEIMLKAMASFYHPSNYGKWTSSLLRFMNKLSTQFVRRLHRERYQAASWETPVPAEKKLTDADVTRFVESLLPVVHLSMFSKLGSSDSASTLHQLSSMRPEIVIPPLIEKFYVALETVTEPHRLTATLNCMVGVSRSLLAGSHFYPEGRTHALPALQCSLPGLDPNDMKKCMVTFQFLSTMFSLIPFVDCSAALKRDDLTEVERRICEQTANFEDFVLQFLDKVLILIQNCSGAESTRADAAAWGNSAATEKLTNEESMMQIGMTSTVAAILQQSSPAIFKLALERIFRFSTTSVLEPKLAGRYTGDLVRSAVKVDPPQALNLFLPFIHKKLMSLLTESTFEEENLDDEILWNLQMMSEIVRSDGQELVKYSQQILQVLDKSNRLTCKQGYEFSATILRNLFKALTLTYSLNYSSVTVPLGMPPEEHFYVRDWAKPGDVYNLGLRWHSPNEEELHFAQRLFDVFVLPEVEALDAFADDRLQLKRERLQRGLNLVLQTLQGLACVLPQWTGQFLHPMPSQVSLANPPRLAFERPCVVRFRSEKIRRADDGGGGGDSGSNDNNNDNVRENIAVVMRKLKAAILERIPDDTKSLYLLIAILQSLLMFHGASRDDFDARWKSFHVVKRAMENKLVRKKRHMRALLIDRTVLQHERRLLNRSYQPYTSLHLDILRDLFQLSTSHYGEVRIRAQNILSQGLHVFTYSYMHLLDDIVELLKESDDVTHDHFKGALYVLIGPKHRCLAVKPHWSVISRLWPAIVQAQHSEKPSIQLLMDELIDKISKNMDTIAIDFAMQDSTLAFASQFWSSQQSLPLPSLPPPSSEEMSSCAAAESAAVASKTREYESLVQRLVGLIVSGNLRWKFAQVALALTGMLFRYDRPLPEPGVKVVTDLLLHDTVLVRKMSISGVSALLKQSKRPHKKVQIDLNSMAGPEVSARSNGVVRPGSRADNAWMEYDPSSVPRTEEDWSTANFVDKTHWGFYCWPKRLEVYAPRDKQPVVPQPREAMDRVEGIIYDFFSSKDNVDKLIEFLSLEERKGKDKFSAKRFILFKGLFRNYGPAFLPLLRPHLEKLSTDSIESKQRCAAEIVAGLVRGSKHWAFTDLESMWAWLAPLLETAFANITTETVVDWGTCIATCSESRDPRRIHWLLEVVMKDPVKGEIDSSFRDTNHLYALQGALSQQEWRVPTLLHRHLEQVLPHIHHPYKNMRDRLGSVLTSIYLYDWTFPGGPECRSPRKKSFIERILPGLEALKISSGPQAEAEKIQKSEGSSSSADDLDYKDSSAYKGAVQICETLISWYKASASRTLDGFSSEMFSAIPYFCALEGEATDEALKKECFTVLYVLASAQQKASTLERLVDVLVSVKETGSWHARISLLRFLQIMVFTNLPLLKSFSTHSSTLTSLVTDLLADERLEVREAAGITLGGFFHCRFASIEEKILASFRKLANTRIGAALKSGAATAAAAAANRAPAEEARRRHGGVLGLCAVVQAFPYDVPDILPPVLMEVCDHIHDPMPISESAKRTLSSFRRTHYDNWEDHKLKFSEEEIHTLTDILVSPNYYA